MVDKYRKIDSLIQNIYGELSAEFLPRIVHLIERYQEEIGKHRKPRDEGFHQSDAVLITYGDIVREEGIPPLQTLNKLMVEEVGRLIQTIHILPFFPFSSDDGFSVIDYKAVNPDCGDWDDIHHLGRDYQLMFDAVINHISAKSEWFQGYLRGDEEYQEYFIEVDPTEDLTTVFRPRALPLLSEFDTAYGTKWLWTTFSRDQPDINYANPEVLMEILDVLLNYVLKGADHIRLDAIAFLWKEIGTNCIHLPETHWVIQLIREVFRLCAPWVKLFTETNVPHEENISYFGDGTNEAHLVYNFSLPPLLLHSFHTGNSRILSDWAAKIDVPGDQVAFFNFTASHDGIGVMPARGILPPEGIDAMADRVVTLGGHVSYKNNPDGTRSAYELNINYLDALGNPEKEETDAIKARRFLTSQAVMLAFKGIPGIYFHSLFGSQNWYEGVQKTGMRRSINREKVDLDTLLLELKVDSSIRQQVFKGYLKLLDVRIKQPAFHPNAKQEILALDDRVFAIKRISVDEKQILLCLHNLSDQVVRIKVINDVLPIGARQSGIDLITEDAIDSTDEIFVEEYEMRWIAFEQR